LASQPAISAAPGTNDKALIGPISTERYSATFIRLGASNMNGVLYEPTAAAARIAVVLASPKALYDPAPALELASRGYRVLAARHYMGSRRGEVDSPTDGALEISRSITYLRTLPGVQRVVVMGHSDGGRLAVFYANLAEHGPAVCARPEALYPCKGAGLDQLARPDGIVLLDPDPGAFRLLNSIDPAYVGNRRTKVELDIYSAANGFDEKAGNTKATPEFVKRFQAAQAALYTQLVDGAVTRLRALEQGKGAYRDDEPLTVPGTRDGRLYYIDTTRMSHSRQPHTLLKADGGTSATIIHSVRPAIAPPRSSVGSFASANHTTVRHFLANDAIRVTKDFAVTEDNIVGVDWNSSNTSTPFHAEGTTVPTLLAVANCSWLVVPGEIIYEHLAAKDKTYVAIDGALHDFAPCKSEYGDTRRRTFDFVVGWLSKPGRF
jgi:pimeloyl-ACP methyl ester carboxylesterase